MDAESKAKRSLILFLVFGIALFIFGANCTLGRMISDEYQQDQTNTAKVAATSWAQTYTERARNLNSQTQTVIQATYNFRDTEAAVTQKAAMVTLNAEGTATEAKNTEAAAKRAATETADWQTEQAPKPPYIIDIKFPGEIPGNNSTIIGLLYFKDPDGDISHVAYRVITAEHFVGGTDNNPSLDSGTWQRGALKIYLWCEGKQYVTLEATLFDQAGNNSNSMTFSFDCK